MGKIVCARAAMSPKVRRLIDSPTLRPVFMAALHKAFQTGADTFTSCGLTLTSRKPAPNPRSRQMSEYRLARIVPPVAGEHGATLTRGTNVILPSGERLNGVTRITLTADTDDVWRASIECVVEPPPINAAIRAILYRREGWLARWWRRLRGEPIEVTAMDPTGYRRFMD